MDNQSIRPALDQSRQHAVFERLRTGILSGTLAPGARLPATRHLAEELGVARQTVVLAYERLAAEGYVRARMGSGTYVATDLPDAAPAPGPAATAGLGVLSKRGAAIAATPMNALAPGASDIALLAPGVPANELFPTAAWARETARVLRTLPHQHLGYPDPQGLPELRTEIAAHLAATRGLIADPGQIVVTTGTQQALRVAADLVLDPGEPAWVEEPGYIAGRGALIAAGVAPVPVTSDADGLDVAEGISRAPDARLALVAPSHATPLGGALTIGRRLALLDWAAQAGAWILEDDCDSEFRWSGKPLPPLASLDAAHGATGRVIYCGTFSKTLAPALRLGFAVVPAPLTTAFVRVRALTDRGPASLQQAVLAGFMRAGLLGPHIRRMRTEYARRRVALLEALRRHCPQATPLAAPGGLHLVVQLARGSHERRIVAAARERGLAVAPLAAYHSEAPAMTGLVLGFATCPVAMAGDAARRLAAAIRAGA
jgi:GntR family transcriptional regulator/MocR family aminotransferase